MWLLLVFTLFGLTIKIWAAHRLWHNRQKGVAVLALLVLSSAFAQSILELINYYCLLNSCTFDKVSILRWYHGLIIVFLVPMCFLTVGAIKGKLSYWLTIPVVLASILLAAWIVVSDDFVVGFVALPQAYTRIPGNYYWVFQSVALGALLTGTLLPIALYHLAKREMHRIKAAALITGMVGIFFVGVLIIGLMHFGIPVTGAGIGTLVMSFYLMLLSGCLTDHMIRDIRADLWFWSEEFKEARWLTRHLRYKPHDPVDAKQSTEEYMRSLVKQAYKVHERQGEVAEALNISPSSVSRRLSSQKKYGHKKSPDAS